MAEAWLILPAFLIWLGVLLLPWRPWGTTESLDTLGVVEEDFSDVTVLIPARNESDVIQTTLQGLMRQGRNLKIVLVDDQSDDNTVQAAQSLTLDNLHIVTGQRLPSGWSGKLWALEQGRPYIDTELALLLDADIELLPGTLSALRSKMNNEDLELVSLMAHLNMVEFWERLLMPAFVYFFKLLYPFRLSNAQGNNYIAAAAGGCILLRARIIENMGGFGVIKHELIDDCALARQVKSMGKKTWIGLTHSARSLRPYRHLAMIWNMVARTAFAQLGYSGIRLVLCSVVMITAFLMPLVGLFAYSEWGIFLSIGTLAMMMFSYLPTLKYYGLSSLWALALPGIGLLYLAMTWTSAAWYWLGERSQWKGRLYSHIKET